MRDYISDEANGRRWGLIWAVVYLGFWLLLMIFVKFPARDVAERDQGIMINFGDVDEAEGDEDTALSDISSQRPVEAYPHSRPMVITPTPNGDVEVPHSPDHPRTSQPNQPVVEQPRQADPRALFPGRTAGSTSPSEGTGTGIGNQGNPAGSPDGSHTGTGTGTSGTSFNLSGRSAMGALPLPAYDRDKEGKVVIEVTVNPEGKVTNAVYRPAGSSTNDAQLVKAAREAALRSRFSKAEIENLQTGTITYVFKMK